MRKIFKLDYTDIIKMIETESDLRNWGRSIGVVIPKKLIEKENLKPGDTVQLRIVKKQNPLRQVFGSVKMKIDTQKLLDESDKELWDD